MIDDEIDDTEFDGLPSTDIGVEYRIGFAMTGSFPLHLSDIFFCDDGVYLLEYGNITPLLGATTRKHHREAETMESVYEYHGIDEVILQADFVTWINYNYLDIITVYDGGLFARPKVIFELSNGLSYSYRIHNSPPAEEIVENIGLLNLPIESKSGHGFSLTDLTGR